MSAPTLIGGVAGFAGSGAAIFASSRASSVRSVSICACCSTIRSACSTATESRQNETDREERKAIAGRFVANAASGLRLGISGAWGGPDEPGRPRRERIGGEVLFTRGALELAGELMTGRDGAIERSAGVPAG